MVQADRIDHSISDILDATMTHVRPDTNDAPYLDRQSREQLDWFTYRPGYPLSEFADGNRLVPDAVAEVDGEEYPSQGFPVNQLVSLLIPDEDLSDNTVEVAINWFQPSKVGYRKPYNMSYGTARNRGEEVLETGSIGDWEISIAGENAPKTTTGPAVGFKHTAEVTLEDGEYLETIESPGHSSLLRYCDTNGENPETPQINQFGQSSEDLSASRRSTIGIEYERIDLTLEFRLEVVESAAPAGYTRVVCELRNRTEVNPDDFVEKRLGSILNPTFSLTFDNCSPVFPEQQHAPNLRQEFGTDDIDPEVAELREYDSKVYTQRNTILTQSVSDESKFISTMWGVYDFVEQVSPDKKTVDIEQLANDRDYLFDNLNRLSGEELEELSRADSSIIENLQKIFSAVPDGLGIERSLYSVQWAAIQERVKLLLDDEKDNSLVVRAPTSAGKTAVYFVSTALVVLENETRAFLPFPTTTLTDGMLERLITFVDAIRDHTDVDMSCGVVMGKDTDPREFGLNRREDVYLDAAEFADYIENCHRCGDDDLSVNRRCAKCAGPVTEGWTDNGHHKFSCNRCNSTGARHHLQCDHCEHEYSYVYDHDGTTRYLPDIVVGTPDKLYRMATVESYSEHSTYSSLPFFGAPYSPCEHCGRALTDMNGYSAQRNNPSLRCDACSEWTNVGWNFQNRPDSSDIEYNPIGHVVLDETHMYTGEFGAGISVMIAFLRVLASRFESPRENTVGHKISVDAGTATTGNALTHIQRLIREEDPVVVPADNERGDHFEADPESVRYRVLGFQPIAGTARNSFRRGMVHQYRCFEDDEFEIELENKIDESDSDLDIDDLRLLLGYVYRKSDGEALSESIQDLFRRETSRNLDVPFMSGEMKKAQRRSLLGEAESLNTKMLLANMVVSLGLDIENLNNMILFGACRSTSEQIQAVGRTGRGEAAGHAAIHLFPHRTRDSHLYARFHDMLANVDEYVEEAIIQPTNPHVADQHFLEVLSPFVTNQMALHNAGTDHKVGDLIDILENQDPAEKVIKQANDYTENDVSWMHVRLLKDMKTIFAPDNIDMPGEFHEIILGRIIDMYIENMQRGSGEFYSADNSQRLNDWFWKNSSGSIRGSGSESVSVRMETGYTEKPQ